MNPIFFSALVFSVPSVTLWFVLYRRYIFTTRRNWSGIASISSGDSLPILTMRSRIQFQRSTARAWFFGFSVGSTASARPTLNITGLTVQSTNASGMRINVDPAAITRAGQASPYDHLRAG